MSSSNNNFLTRLELQGFKSFASKTVFDFEGSRAVGIVGPNGSGKSNIIDAIRWSLGETGASRLRGDVLKNLIFAGTPKKSASGLAKVTLCFDNRSDILPVDAKEVNITRKIDRSGSSDFLINNQEVRLKDLEPMFAKARLGSRGLMIIGQGQSDVIVRSSPSERREMVEEVLGLKEFRIKKKSAQRRLDKSKNNIDKINAKIEEIAPHLRFLKKQKTKWEQRSEIETKLEDLSKKYFSHKYHKYNDSLSNIKSELSSWREKENKQNKEISIIEKEIDSIDKEEKDKEKISDIRQNINSLDRKRNELERKLARLEAEKEYKSKTKDDNKQNDLPSSSYLANLISSFIEDIKPAYKENDSQKVRNILDRWVSKFESIFPDDKEEESSKESSEIDEKIKSLKSNIDSLSGDISKLRKKEDNLLLGQEKENKEFRAKVEELEDKKDKARKISQRIQDLSLKKERIDYKLKELKEKWQNIGFDINQLHNIPKPENQSNQDMNWQEIGSKIDRLRSKLSSIGEIDKSLINEAEEMEERYKTLADKKEDLEAAAEDLEELIQNLDKKIHNDFKKAFSHINKEFNNFFRLMFGGGQARMSLKKPDLSEEQQEELEEEEKERMAGIDISLKIPKKKITGMDMLSGGEKTLVSIAALFALVSVSPPPFLVLDEIDAALDDVNSKRFADLIKDFSEKTQFIIVTHNRITMESVDALYGITMGDDGVSTVLSIKLEEAEEMVSSET